MFGPVIGEGAWRGGGQSRKLVESGVGGGL
jgi:hypothetical protein